MPAEGADRAQTPPTAVHVEQSDTLLADSSPGARGRGTLTDRRLAHFQVEHLIGSGGMGAVYRAFDTSLERPVALKVLLVDRPEARERFMREARAQANLRHPNVVPIHYVGEDQGVVFLVMDLIDGETVTDRLRRDGPMPFMRAIDVIDAVATALAAGHERGLVHRDVKPSNVLLSGDHVLLADFGLAKHVDAAVEPQAPAVSGDRPAADTLTREGALVGTPAYMAPEQIDGGKVDGRTDIYALGVTLYEVLSGQPPFTGSGVDLLRQHREDAPLPLRTLAPTVPKRVATVVHRMLQKRPEDRFEHCAELKRALAEARGVKLRPGGMFVRAFALTLDLLVLAIPASLVGELHGVLSAPFMVLVMCLCEIRWGKTLGKHLMSLRTIDRHDEKPRPLTAVIRAIVKMWGALAFGTISALVGRPEPLWAQIAVSAATILWLGSLLIAATKGKRAPHDRLLGTRVVYTMADDGA